MGLTQSSIPYENFQNHPATRPAAVPSRVIPHNTRIIRASQVGTYRSSVGQVSRNRDVAGRVSSSGPGLQGPTAGAEGRINRQPSKRRHTIRKVHKQQSSQRQRVRRIHPTGLQDGLVPADAHSSSSGHDTVRSGAARFPKLKAAADTRGVDYEERSLALAFLRCLRDNLRFDISSNNEAAGKFDDLVVRWRYNNSAEPYVLLAQLKHKSATHGSSEVCRAMLLPQNFGANNRFSVALYQDSYHRIRDKLKTPNFTLILSTNAPLASDTRGTVVRRSLTGVPGAEFLDTGGTLYGLNPNDEEVRRAVKDDHRFIEHFAIFCNQKDSEEIKDAICREIDILLAPREAEGYIYENLCREIREWKLNEDLWLSESWKKWTGIVNDYTEKFVCQCGDKSVRPPIVFNGVENIRKFVGSHNPALITPLRRSTTALTASKVHQAVGGETHVLLTARRYRQLRQQVLCVWGRFCKWLVILDDGTEDDIEVFQELSSHLSSSRLLVFVTSQRDGFLLDTFGSFQVSDESWSKFLEIRIRLNGDSYLCTLRDLVGDPGSMKKLLENRPEDVIALSQSTGTLDMGQQLDPVPDYFVSRRMVVRRYVVEDFFLSLGEKDVCIIDRASYAFVPAQAWRGVIRDLRRLDIVLCSPHIVWPLLAVVGDTDRSAVENLYVRHPEVRFYAFSYCDDGWQILYFNSNSDRFQPYTKMQVIQAPEELDLSKGRVILEGSPGIGKSLMLAAIARHVKALDPTYWVVKVNFSEFYNIFENCDNSTDALEQVLLNVTRAEDQLGHLERTLLRHCLEHSPHVACLIDGFDEMISAYTDISLQILKQLTPNAGAMLVTARPAARKYLEQTLGSMACLLTTFSDTELQMFLRMYGPTPAGSVDYIVANIPKSLLRFPLFCKMSADLTGHGVVTNLTELYNAFFQSKCERLWVKKQGTYSCVGGGKQEFEQEWKRYEEELMYLAVSFLVQAKDRLGQRLYSPINKDVFVEAGIMCRSADGRLVFVHRTFAEYFLAKWCFTSIGQPECAVLYRQALLDKNLEFFVRTFDCMATKGHRLHELIVDGDESAVMLMLNCRVDAAERDRAGRNALHLATVYCELWTVVQGLCARMAPRAVEAEDDLLHWTPLRYAVQLGRWPTVAALVKAGAQVEQLGDLKAAKYDFSELKNWLPNSAFQKFMQYVNLGRSAFSSFQSKESQGKAMIKASPTLGPSNNSQADECQNTTKMGTSSQVGMTSGKNSQLNGQHLKSSDSGLKANGRPSTKMVIMSSEVVVGQLNALPPQIQNGKAIDNNVHSNQCGSTEKGRYPSMVLSNNQHPQVCDGQITDNTLQPNEQHSTTKTRTNNQLVKQLFNEDLSSDNLFDDCQPQLSRGNSTGKGPNERPNATKTRAASHVESDLFDDSQPQVHNELQSNQRHSTPKVGKSSRLVITASNDPKKQLLQGRIVDNSPKSNVSSSTANPETSSEMEKPSSNNSRTHVHHRVSTGSSPQLNVDQSTATTSPSVEEGMDASNDSPISASSQISRSRCCLTAFRVVFCCSRSVPDNGSNRGDGNAN